MWNLWYFPQNLWLWFKKLIPFFDEFWVNFLTMLSYLTEVCFPHYLLVIVFLCYFCCQLLQYCCVPVMHGMAFSISVIVGWHLHSSWFIWVLKTFEYDSFDILVPLWGCYHKHLCVFVWNVKSEWFLSTLTHTNLEKFSGLKLYSYCFGMTSISLCLFLTQTLITYDWENFERACCFGFHKSVHFI